jgi:hypothetical protein
MYEESWTYHPLLNISVIPQRSYNLAPSVASMLVRQANRHNFLKKSVFYFSRQELLFNTIYFSIKNLLYMLLTNQYDIRVTGQLD